MDHNDKNAELICVSIRNEYWLFETYCKSGIETYLTCGYKIYQFFTEYFRISKYMYKRKNRNYLLKWFIATFICNICETSSKEDFIAFVHRAADKRHFIDTPIDTFVFFLSRVLKFIKKVYLTIVITFYLSIIVTSQYITPLSCISMFLKNG